MISEEQVRHVANLARLGLTDDEIEKMGGQLDMILESMRRSAGAGSLGRAAYGEPARPLERPAPRRAAPRVLAGTGALPAPERVDDLFAVPRID